MRGPGAAHARSLVARVQPNGPGVFPRYDLDKEARVISALGEHTGVPVPKVYAFESDPAVFGSPFLVMGRVDGRVPSDDPPFTAGGWVLDLTPQQRTTMWHNSIDVLAAIHGSDWQALGLDFLDTTANGSGLDAQLADCRATFAWAAEGEPNPTIEYALDWLDARARERAFHARSAEWQMRQRPVVVGDWSADFAYDWVRSTKRPCARP